MKAYLGEQPGDSVVFGEHYSTKATANHRINDYYLLNLSNRKMEKRIIKTGGADDVFIISFAKREKTGAPFKQYPALRVFPNPARNRASIEYQLEKEGLVLIELFDINGRKVKTVVSSGQTAGLYSIDCLLSNDNGVKLRTGIYTVRLSAGGQIVNKKLMVK